MKDRLAHRLRFSWDGLSVPGAASAIAVPPSLIVHDPDAPWSGAAAFAQAWPGSRLLTTSGLGHRRLLKAPTVLNQVAEFLSKPS